MPVELRPFLGEHLPRVEGWFYHPEVRLRLGGPDWPRRALETRTRELAGDEEFRGALVLREHAWLAWDGDEPVAYLGGEVYDRWTTWDGSDEEHPYVVRSEAGPAMGAAYVVDPARWRRGHGAATLRAWQRVPEVADVRVLALGVDHDNAASIACARSAGFTPDVPEPDWEGIIHQVWRRPR